MKPYFFLHERRKKKSSSPENEYLENSFAFGENVEKHLPWI
jgi:hypothetical protein